MFTYKNFWQFSSLFCFGLIPFFWQYAFWVILILFFFGIYQNYNKIKLAKIVFELKKDRILLAFLFYFFFNTLFFITQETEFNSQHLEPWVFGILMVILFSVVRSIETEITYQHAALTVGLGLFLATLFLLSERLGFGFEANNRVRGLTSNTLVIGLIYGLAAGWCASFLFTERNFYFRALAVILLIVAFITATFFTSSRTLSVCAFVGLAYFIWLLIQITKKYHLIFFAALLLIILPISIHLIELSSGGESIKRLLVAFTDIMSRGYLQDSSSLQRFELWARAADLIWHKPIFGYGSFNEKSLLDYKYWYAHNQYLSWLISGGTIGLLLGCLALFYGYRSFPIEKNKCANLKFVMLIYLITPLITNSDLMATATLHHVLAFLSLFKNEFKKSDSIEI